MRSEDRIGKWAINLMLLNVSSCKFGQKAGSARGARGAGRGEQHWRRKENPSIGLSRELRLPLACTNIIESLNQAAPLRR